MCSGDDAFSSDATRGDVASFGGAHTLVLDPTANRYFAVSDPLHERFAELSPAPSRLYVIDLLTAATAEEFESGITGHLVFDEREWLITGDGRLVDSETGEIGGTVPATADEIRELAPYIQRVGCDALMVTNVQLIHVDCHGVVTPLPLSMEGIRSLRAGADGSHFVVGFVDSVELLHLDGSSHVSVDVPWSSTKQYIRDADVSPDGLTLAAIDSLGEIHTTRLDGSDEWTRLPGALSAGNSQLAYSAEGNLVVLGSDRLVRLVDSANNTIAIQTVPSSNTRMRISGSVVVLSSTTGTGIVIDASTLDAIEELPRGAFDRQSDGTLRGLTQYSSDGITVTSASTITMPAITP